MPDHQRSSRGSDTLISGQHMKRWLTIASVTTITGFLLLALYSLLSPKSFTRSVAAQPAIPTIAHNNSYQFEREGSSPISRATATSGLVTEDLSGTLTATDLAMMLVGNGVPISNVTYTGVNRAAGRFSGGMGIIGFDSGIILSSGDIAYVIGPNQYDRISANNNAPGDADLSTLSGFATNDAAVLEFDFVPDSTTIYVRFVFASDEYNEYVNTSFNDTFAFFVNGINCATVNGDPVSINTINNGFPFGTDPRSNPHLYINNDLDDGGGNINTEMDGLTVVLTCVASVTPNASNHIKLAIADAVDRSWDSNVFIEAGSFSAPPIAWGQDWNVECPFCSVADSQQFVQGVNPRTGNFVHGDVWLPSPVAGGTLAFGYGYISEAREMYTTTMGYGWAHQYEMALHFDSTAVTHTVIMQAPGGSRFPFYGNGDGSYTRYAGVTANLMRIDGANPEDTIYRVTTYNQFQATFDYQGRLVERKDPHGRAITFTYANFNGTERLYRASQGGRFLEFDYYSGNGRLHTVTDNANRTVILSYQGDDLHTVTGPANTAVTYEYDSGDNLLTRVIDGADITVKRIFYDNQGRAYRVEDGDGRVLVDVDFGSGESLMLTTADLSATSVVTATGTVMTFTYGRRGTLLDVTFACQDYTPGCQSSIGVGYDYNFKQDSVQDANGNPTTLRWDAGGSNLEYQRDALGHETLMTYDLFNNLTRTIDARQNPTTYTYHYNDPDDPYWPYLPTFRSSLTDTLGNTTLYTPTVAGITGPLDGQLYEEQDANGVVIRYGYNDYGQVTQTVRAVGTPDAITTTYGYDGVGRLITTTQTSLLDSVTNVNVYDENDRLIAAIANWNDLPDWTACSFDPGPREENICTLYRYDPAGRQISVTNALGQVNVTFYNDAGRRYLDVSNYNYPADSLTLANPVGTLCDFASPHPEYNHCSLTEFDQYGRVFTTTDSIGRQTVTIYDHLSRVAGTIANSVDVTDLEECNLQTFISDRDLCTFYLYDNMGNVAVVTNPMGREFYTEYDALNRVKGTIENWSPGMTLAACMTLPRERNHNICTLYQYDEVGNTIFVTNTLTQTTRTFYDPLNRVKATVVNWQPGFDDPGQCVLSPDNTSDENICTLYGYDKAGNQITTTNALNQTTLTVYDAAGRPFLTVSNWDGITTIEGAADCQFPPAQPDVNVCAVTFYDSLGRRSASQDGMGNLAEFAYDGLGRLITTTQYLDQLPIYTITSYDALGNRLSSTDAEGHTTSYAYDSLNRLVQTTSAEGITNTQTYNAAGWVITSTDGLDHSTVMGYDLLGRRVSLTDPEGNTTTTVYDALGNQVALVDAEDVTTTYQYDGLNRLTAVIENDVPGSNPTNDTDVLTQYRYDALGNRIVITNARGFTSSYTLYDDLNRPIIVRDGLGNETHTGYNALGLRVVMTDGNDAVTEYSYDGLNRLATADYTADSEIVQYAYDALGNRLVMTDTHSASSGQGVGVTTYEYDDLYRLITVTNPFTGVVGYRYDRVGNRTQLIYPDMRAVIYTYDEDNRLIHVDDWEEGITSYEYDAAGRLITTTLPNGVQTVNSYDTANRLIRLHHLEAESAYLLADYQYELDGVGNRLVTTETLRLPTTFLTQTLTSDDMGGEAQVRPEVAHNTDDDEYLVVWQDHRNGETWGVYGQFVAADGTLIGSNFVVVDKKHEADIAVAYSPDDHGYLVVWSDTEDIWARYVSATGTLGTAYRVYDTVAAAPARQPDVSYNETSGQFLVAWSRITMLGYQIQTRTVSKTGTIGSEVSLANQNLPLANPAVAVADTGQILVVWQDRRNGNDDIYGQRLSSSGGTSGSNFAIANASNTEQTPDVVWSDEAQVYLVVWHNNGGIVPVGINGRRVNTSGALIGSVLQVSETNAGLVPAVNGVTDGWLVVWQEGLSNPDVQGQMIADNGTLIGDNVTLVAHSGSQTHPALAGSGDYLLAWQDGRNSHQDIYARAIQPAHLQTTAVQYEYDLLYRLTQATYSGILSGTYAYEYDAVGNRTVYNTNIITTQSITYHYDAANRLVESVKLGSDTTTYEWDNAGRLITTTVGATVSRVYTYSQSGDLTAVLVDNLLTTFVYDGDGRRLQMSVAGEVTTYTLDYAGGFRVLLEEGGAFSDTKHYLYGLACIGELVDADEPESEWRYYHQDGNHLVRQTTNIAATVTLAWAYSPEGAVVLGEKGPVTNLGCGAIYDWSTGLIFKKGRYFDPNTGIWLTLGGFVIHQVERSSRSKQRKYSKGKKRVYLLFFLLLLALALSSCGGGIDKQAIENLGEDIICSPNIPIDWQPSSRAWEKVNIEHVSGPKPTAYGGHDWRVKFRLENPAKSDGWIIQEINTHVRYYSNDDDTLLYGPPDLQFWEAWEVKEGKSERSRSGQSYDDAFSRNGLQGTSGLVEVTGIVRFYEGPLPTTFKVNEVPQAGILRSSTTPPPYWNYEGTAHNFRMSWDGNEITKGFARWGDQLYEWDTTPTLTP